MKKWATIFILLISLTLTGIQYPDESQEKVSEINEEIRTLYDELGGIYELQLMLRELKEHRENEKVINSLAQLVQRFNYIVKAQEANHDYLSNQSRQKLCQRMGERDNSQ